MSLKNQLKVMVVDDMSTSRALITQALDAIGVANYAVENDGQNALKTLSTAPVHLVLSDMNMPNIDGLGLLEALRRNPATARVGFILVTGSPSPEIVQRGQKLGLNNIIKKPFSPAQMKQCIERVVGRL
ncbi:response regulator [Algirhabdus cladophorae]|uniref:response regulator n=1 Tax=Algirhabdus cladophorae TaxID=3377108 RepID=UPI003B84595E